MANTTDPFAQSVHGTNPQYLIEKITRQKIYNCVFWKEQCFGLTSETILDKAIALKYIGGTYGGNLKPTNFLCLVLKLLQLQPEMDIVLEFVKNEDFKYLRALGAFYLRLVGKVDMIYQYLEPLLNDYRKLSYRGMSGWQSMHMDEFVDSLLREELVCDMALPHLVKRMKLEELGTLLPRKSALDDEIANAGEESSSEEEDSDSDGEVQEESAPEAVSTAVVEAEEAARSNGHARTAANGSGSHSADHRDERGDERPAAEREDGGERRDREYSRGDHKDRRERSRSPRDRRGDRRDHRDRRDSRDRSDRKSDLRRSDSEDRRRDRRHDDRRDDRDRRDGRSGSRRSPSRSRSPSSGSDYDRRRRRHRSPDRRRDRSRDRDSRHDHRDDRHRPRSRSPSSPRRRHSDRRSTDRRDRSEDRYRKRDRSPDRGGRDDRDDREGKRSKPAVESDDDWMPTPAAAAVPEPAAVKKDSKSAAEKKFDRMFGGKGKSQPSAGTSAPASRATSAAPAASSGGRGGGGKEIINSKGEKVVITASEGTVEYWNQMREALGMKKLK